MQLQGRELPLKISFLFQQVLCGMVGKRGINGFIAREESFSRSRKVESVDWFCYAITEEDIAPWSVVHSTESYECNSRDTSTAAAGKRINSV